MASEYVEHPPQSRPPITTFPTSPTSISSPRMSVTTDQAGPLPSLSSIASAGLRASPSPRTPKRLREGSPRFEPAPLTAAAAQADERRAREERGRERAQVPLQSANPAAAALGALLAPRQGLSKAADTPSAATTMSDGVAVAAGVMSRPDGMQVDRPAATSPVSASSTASPSSGATTALLNPSGGSSRTTAGPLEPDKHLGTAYGDSFARATPEVASPVEDRPANRAFTFPGPPADNTPPGSARAPPRGMSLPMPESRVDAAKSPSSNRKHKCPYCATDFTRHHNLKSHLLTHSHEKPFVCSTCQARFRRLHDLKRHTKLHTGEKPHICPQCGRRFARGDALARHNKGSGGCAGRRASLGSLGDDDYDDSFQDHGESGGDTNDGEDGMDGLLYTSEGAHDSDRMDESREVPSLDRSASLPTIRAPDASDGARHEHASTGLASYPPPQFPNTYPPGTRPRADPSTGASPGLPAGRFSPKTSGPSPSGPLHPGGSSLYGQGNITESPKPLSPGVSGSQPQLGPGEGAHLRAHRSPSLTEQFQQQHFGRKTGGGRSSPPVGLPPLSGNAHAPHLPSLSGLARSDGRFSLPGQSASAPSTAPGGGPAPASAYRPSNVSPSSNAFPPPGTPRAGTHVAGEASSGSMEGGGTAALWAYVRGLEERLNALSDEVVRLRNDAGRPARRPGRGSA
ncbi:MAG: hypothetical protein M1838_003147 [Thelocarpon superellum]|nr:MAG: hypothetical protein M1838_003147 [Thelocarpon superellum]